MPTAELTDHMKWNRIPRHGRSSLLALAKQPGSMLEAGAIGALLSIPGSAVSLGLRTAESVGVRMLSRIAYSTTFWGVSEEVAEWVEKMGGRS